LRERILGRRSQPVHLLPSADIMLRLPSAICWSAPTRPQRI
jgi:hypothetical protein